ncbi:hypothetical protein BBD41_25250 [Paenibacillus ihbetae]|uniref:Uncharacterized protein n=1 Tax=Paenibacillus ihbetae TaxID=1870820 RepID=A0A1B2E6K9_9BACL|nr:hypothetical protein BBD41_25250 [Paenibacillus ihbetae]OOC62210.1 hypothetical protein BBD40_10290 [Paenibacillus ihbetae]
MIRMELHYLTETKNPLKGFRGTVDVTSIHLEQLECSMLVVDIDAISKELSPMWIYSAGGQFFYIKNRLISQVIIMRFSRIIRTYRGGIGARIGRVNGIFWIGVRRPRSLRMKYVN